MQFIDLNLRKNFILIIYIPFLVDDCTKKNTPCGQNALCVKGANGVHECLCQDGYRKNGKDCDGNFRKYICY